MAEDIKGADIPSQEMQDKVANLVKGATGKQVESNYSESPLDVARKLNEDTRKLHQEILETNKKIEQAVADMMVSGRGYAGQAPKKEMTEEEKINLDASKFINHLKSR